MNREPAGPTATGGAAGGGGQVEISPAGRVAGSCGTPAPRLCSQGVPSSTKPRGGRANTAPRRHPPPTAGVTRCVVGSRRSSSTCYHLPPYPPQHSDRRHTAGEPATEYTHGGQHTDIDNRQTGRAHFIAYPDVRLAGVCVVMSIASPDKWWYSCAVHLPGQLKGAYCNSL